MPGTTSITALRSHHDVDPTHSAQDCALSEALFLATAEHHALSPVYLPLLQAAALAHDIGISIDERNHPNEGRDLLMRRRLRRMAAHEQRAVACIVAFHRGEIVPEREPLWHELPERLREPVLKLAAILRIADGLDYTHDSSVAVVNARRKKRAHVLVTGNKSLGRNIDRAVEKSDLWEETVGSPFVLEVSSEAVSPWRPPIHGSMSLAESSRTIVRGYLAQVVAERWRAGLIDAVKPRHRMRVALRRLRMALRMYRRIWKDGPLQQLVDELRWFGDLLGDVRDRDVSLAWLNRRTEDCPSHLRDELRDMRESLERDRRNALYALLPAIDGDRLSHALERVALWSAGPEPDLLLPGAYGSVSERVLPALRRSTERVLIAAGKPEERASEELHRLRRQVRRMRYAVEAWYHTLGRGRRKLLEGLLTVQDALGDVHDADVRIHATLPGASRDLELWLHDVSSQERKDAWNAFQDAWPHLLERLQDDRLRAVAKMKDS